MFVVQIVVSGVADSVTDVTAYALCTMLAASLDTSSDQTQGMISACIQFLQENEFVSLQRVRSSGLYRTDP